MIRFWRLGGSVVKFSKCNGEQADALPVAAAVEPGGDGEPAHAVNE